MSDPKPLDPQDHDPVEHGGAAYVPAAGKISGTHQETVLGDGSDPSRQLELVKNGHRYLFRYSPGEESRVITDLMALAKDPDNPLTMYDAAVLTHQLGQRMGRQIDRLAQ